MEHFVFVCVHLCIWINAHYYYRESLALILDVCVYMLVCIFVTL